MQAHRTLSRSRERGEGMEGQEGGSDPQSIVGADLHQSSMASCPRGGDRNVRLRVALVPERNPVMVAAVVLREREVECEWGSSAGCTRCLWACSACSLLRVKRKRRCHPSCLCVKARTILPRWSEGALQAQTHNMRAKRLYGHPHKPSPRHGRFPPAS
jgi:hypothetical protein